MIEKIKFISVNNYNNWHIQVLYDTYQTKSLKHILEHMLIKFEIIFGRHIMESEDCDVYIESNSECPMLITSTPRLLIRLSVESATYWSQVIYQLSHELCHYTLRQTSCGNESLKWVEETLCEAMSMYILEYFYETWDDFVLSRDYPNYREHIKNYLMGIYEEEYGIGLADCKNKNQLIQLNIVSERDRQERVRERNIVYNIFKSKPEKIRLIDQYQSYRDDIIIDFNKWKDKSNEIFIEELSQIQPILDNIF